MKQSNFTIFISIVTLYGLVGHTAAFYLPLYFKDLGFSGAETGLYFSVSSAAMIVLSLPMGISTDRIALPVIFFVSFLLMGLSFVGFVVSESFYVFCLFAFLGSFGKRFYQTASSTMFFKITGNKNQNPAGIFQLFYFVSMGLGMLVGGYLIDDYSFKHVFVFSLIAFAALALLSFQLPRTETVTIKLEEYKKAVLAPRILIITLVFFLSSIHWGAEMVAYIPFLKENLGLSIKQTGIFSSIGFTFVGFGAYFGVVILNKGWLKNLESMLALGLFMAGLFHILMCIESLYWSFAFRILHEIGDGFVFIVFYIGISKVFNLDRIGGCTAFITLWMGVGTFVSAAVFGHMGEVAGHQWPLMVSGAVLLLTPLVLLFTRSKNIYKEA